MTLLAAHLPEEAMPWSTRDTMSLREEFVLLAQRPDANRRALCRRFAISPQTAYKWLARYAQEGREGLVDASRRPRSCPRQTAPDCEALVLAVRGDHPAWGGRKISRRLHDLGLAEVPPSTVTAILHRHGLIQPAASAAATPWHRFEHAAPNDLWQMDFKGAVSTSQGPCHPLTVLDDHSRFNLALQACARQEHGLVQAHLTHAFRRYGLPVRINTDNGAPWGCPRQPGRVSTLAVWLIRLGIRVSFSRPYHPQTNGKDERFHRSLNAEVLNGRAFTSLLHAQAALDPWRDIYNQQRPHDALALATPISRYWPSPRAFPDRLPPILYSSDDTVVTVGWNGELRVFGRRFKVSSALHRLPVAVRPDAGIDGRFSVHFLHHELTHIDLRETQ